MAQITFPIGRLIGGSVSTLHPRMEADGKTPKIGRDQKPVMAINFGVAFPKTQQAWQNEPWGAQVFDIGKVAHPQMHVSPAYSWKVVDGDSVIPNKSGKTPVSQTGYAGNWVIWFSQGWAPKLCNADGSLEMPAERFVAGYYVQVLGEVTGNGAQPPNTPGVYMNPVAVALAGEGDVIQVSVDTTQAGFGGALPAGAKPVQAAVAGFASPAAAPYVAPQAAAAVPLTQVAPNAAFMMPPPAHVMTALAGGATYEAMIAAGWNDALLRQHGMMV